jgi:acyl carrier protein
METATEDAGNLNIEALVIQTLIDQLGVDAKQCTPEAQIVLDLGADSLDAVELMLSFEGVLGIEIADEDAQKLQTVGQLTEFLKEQILAK